MSAQGKLLVLLICLCAFSSCSGVGSNSTEQSLQDQGCKIDAARICAGVTSQPVVMSNGLTADQRMVEQNSLVTSDMVVPIAMPNGEPDLTIHCGINPKYQSVTYANVAPGPAVSEDGVKFLRARGYCSEQ